MRIRAYLLLLFCLCWSALVSAAPLATGFTYQGSLKANGSAAADGDYDFQFTLYAADTGGSPLAGPVNVMAQTVSEGVFTAALDFGAAFDGSPRFLEIQVRKVGDPAFVVLSPRQAVTPTPYALRAASVTDNTIVANNIVDASVGTAELADGSVTFPKLADNAVGNSKIGPGVVTASKVNPFEIQLRVAALCARGAPMIGITQAGQPICDHPLRSIPGIGGERVGLVIRADGRPLLALPGPRLYDCDDAECSSATVTSGGMPSGNDVALALRSDGRPVLAYGGPSGGAQNLVICGNATCSAGNVVRTPASDSFGAFSHVAVRADNTPVMVYFDGSFNNKVVACNDANCAAPTITTVVPGSAQLSPSAFRIRPNGTPVIALRSFGHPTHALYDCNDANCSSGTLRSLVQGIGSRFVLGLAVRSDNRPVVSSSDFSNGFLHDCSDAGCSANLRRDFLSNETFGQSALTLRADGRPLVFYNQAGTGTLKLFDCNNTECSSGTARPVDQSQAFGDAQLAIALRADGRPVMAYPAGSGEFRLLMCATPACQ
ncbi:MAG: hypothetical protein LKM32_00665 [Chiayiivirga sp.]|jgi:hypothetical protein|uniref:hypothetical protein n=1 Tax=Chiayiivirga sp. TaxID=2041042 RepID=UPI0025BC24D7|nr:hypothetical protein [Chiayiivirga sp.]MCI1711249.1 hypothetical protein [Chiayiivirga sp.]MCI1727948.1 hypothetical protein [Chiayiivirga sp.]